MRTSTARITDKEIAGGLWTEAQSDSDPAAAGHSTNRRHVDAQEGVTTRWLTRHTAFREMSELR